MKILEFMPFPFMFLNCDCDSEFFFFNIPCWIGRCRANFNLLVRRKVASGVKVKLNLPIIEVILSFNCGFKSGKL